MVPASSYALVEASPRVLRYNVFQGFGPPLTITQDDLLTDTEDAPGPLRTKLLSITTAAAWNALDNDPELSVYTSPYTSTLPAPAGPTTTGFAFGQSGPDNVLILPYTGVSGRSIVEIRFNPSFCQ